MSEQRLVCPQCARSYPGDERFCPTCGMPLIHAQTAREAELVTDGRHEHARKIKPQYAEGRLVTVARVENRIEAEFIEGLLLEEGIPCVLRASIAGYAPIVDPRDILVPESGAQAAREALAWSRP
jgi:hypothetical protein